MREFTLQQLTERADDPAVNRYLTGLSTGGAAAMLGVSRQRVHQLLDAGKLDAIRVLDARRTFVATLIAMDSIRERIRSTRSAA